MFIKPDLDLILYAINPDGATHAENIETYLNEHFGLKTQLEIAVPSQMDHWLAAKLRSADPAFDDSTRLLSRAKFANREIEFASGSDNMNLSDGVPVFIVHPVYFHTDYPSVPDSEIAYLFAAIQNISHQAPNSDIYVVFPDIPYSLSHNHKKYKEKGRFEAEMLQEYVLANLRFWGAKGIVSYYAHAPKETWHGCHAKKVRAAKKTYTTLDSLLWVDIDPYGGFTINGQRRQNYLNLEKELRKEIFPFEDFISELKNKNALLIYPDGGAHKRIGKKLNKFGIPAVQMEKRRFHEGKIEMGIVKGSFDFVEYVQGLGLKDGDEINLVIPDDFLNTGGTANKGIAYVKEEIWKAVKKVYHDKIPDITIKSTLLVAHAKTMNPIEASLWNLDYIYYTNTHIRFSFIKPDIQAFYNHMRAIEQNGLPEKWQPKKTVDEYYSCVPGLAGGIVSMMKLEGRYLN